MFWHISQTDPDPMPGVPSTVGGLLSSISDFWVDTGILVYIQVAFLIGLAILLIAGIFAWRVKNA